MKLSNQVRYRKAILVSLAAHLGGILLIVVLSLLWPTSFDDIIEVTLAAGDVNSVVDTGAKEVLQQEERKEQQEQKVEEKNEIVDPNLKPKPSEPLETKQKQTMQRTVAGTNSNDAAKHGDGGNDEYTSMPKALKIVKPDYPPAARNQDKQGTVQVKLFISSRGMVEQAEIINSGGYVLLDEAVLKAVYKWRFVAAKNKFGKPCACRVIVPVKFQLKD
ncbi:MAG: energy transducer TonB [Phascolarctobacterium sp.]|nr:energy transducer TonB [Phascolarctobacterium sp.]